jgi:hypothetical protein
MGFNLSVLSLGGAKNKKDADPSEETILETGVPAAAQALRG